MHATTSSADEATGVPLFKDQDAKTEDSLRAVFWRRFKRHRLAIGSLYFLIVLTLIAIPPFTSVVSLNNDPYRPSVMESYAAPSVSHILGTDNVGRDVWARTVYAARVSLSVGLVSVGIACAIAVLLGVIAGYYGGIVDMIIMRATDITMCFPTFVIIVTAVALVGPSIYNTMIVIGIFGWPALTRILRVQVLSVREWEFVMAARAIGATDRRIIVRHVFPNVIGSLVVAATLGVAGAILAEAGLSFLGLGVLPPTPTWGNMLNEAHNLRVLAEMPWIWVPPGVFIFVTVLAINFIGDGLRDALDPRATR